MYNMPTTSLYVTIHQNDTLQASRVSEMNTEQLNSFGKN